MSQSKTCLKIAAKHCNVLASNQNPITCPAIVFLLPLTTSLSLPQFKSFSLPIWAFHVWLSLTNSFYISADGPIGPANIILNQKSGDGGVGGVERYGRVTQVHISELGPLYFCLFYFSAGDPGRAGSKLEKR